jgi:long-chain-fatty-acyl-CoA reductase
MLERRGYPRLGADAAVMANDGSPFDAVLNISEGGVLLRAIQPVEIGEHHPLTLLFPHDESPLGFKVIVRRAVADDAWGCEFLHRSGSGEALARRLDHCAHLTRSPATKLPFIVGGARFMSEQWLALLQPTGTTVAVPNFDRELLRQLVELDRAVLADVPLQEIVAFLNRAGRVWSSSESVRRRLYIGQVTRHLGLTEEMANLEADMIAVLLRSSARLHDAVEVELGSRHILDRWIDQDDCQVRAFPRGLALHLVPGNAAVAAITSLIRGLITKNTNILKLSAADVFSAVAVAQSFLDLDPDHPVTRATHVVYWPSDEDVLGRKLAAEADVLVAWGGAEAVIWAHAAVAPGASLLTFGPRRSIGVVDATAEDLRRIAEAIAHDVCAYDQKACFSVRDVFCLGGAEAVGRLTRALVSALEHYDRILPKASNSADEDAARALFHQREAVFGGEVVRTASGRAAVILSCQPQNLDHPLGRTVRLHPIERVNDVLRFVGPEVQTVAAAPWSLLVAHRDDFARRGVSRIVELGLSNLLRPGGSHDDVYPLSRMVRFVSHEAAAATYGKSMTLPINQSEMIEHGRALDLLDL